MPGGPLPFLPALKGKAVHSKDQSRETGVIFSGGGRARGSGCLDFLRPLTLHPARPLRDCLQELASIACWWPKGREK